MDRVNALLKVEIADLLERQQLGAGKGLVSVTQVEASSDLRYATVYVSVLGDANFKKSVIRALLASRGHLQKSISKDVVMKYTPVLSFKIDERMELGDKVLHILEEIESSDGTAGPAESKSKGGPKDERAKRPGRLPEKK